MKKAIIVFLMLAVCFSGLFAQAAPAAAPAPGVRFEGQVDGWFVPFQFVSRTMPDPASGTLTTDGKGNNDKIDVSQMGMGFGRDGGAPQGPRVGIIITSTNHQYIGFTFALRFMMFRSDVVNTEPGLNAGPTVPGQGTSLNFHGLDGNAHVWYKPFGDDLLNIRFGMYEFDDLRGKIGDPPWIRNFELGGGNADTIFQRFHNNNESGLGGGLGVLFVSKPIPDLLIGLNLKGLYNFQGSQNGPGGSGGGIFEVVNYNTGLNEFGRVVERIQFGVGYTIKDIGLARVQWIGANNYFSTALPTSSNIYSGFGPNMTSIPSIVAPRVEVAFQVLALESMGLMLDIGFKLPFNATAENSGSWVKTAFNNSTNKDEEVYDWVSYDPNRYEFTATPAYQVALGGRWRTTIGEGPTNNLNINFRIDTKFSGSVEVKKWWDSTNNVVVNVNKTLEFPFELNAHVWPSYNLGFATVGLDIGINYSGEYQMDGKVPGKGQTNVTASGADSGARNGEGLNGGMRLGFGAWIAKDVAPNNSVQVGIAFRPSGEFNGVYEDMVFTIPVTFSSRF